MDDNHLLQIQLKLLECYAANTSIFENTEHLVSQHIFTSNLTKECYKCILKLNSEGVKPVPGILINRLSKAGIPKAELSKIATFSEYAYLDQRTVAEYVIDLFNDLVFRQLTPVVAEKYQQLLDKSADPLDIISTLKDKFNTIELIVNNVSKEKSIKAMFKDTLKRIGDLKSGELAQTGFSFGLKKLDQKTGGMVQGITVVAAGKGEGKSSMLINIIVQNAIKDKLPLLFFSLEMPYIEIMTNLIANIKQINSRSLRSGNVDDDQMADISSMENEFPESLVIDDTGGITWQYFEAKVKAFRKKNNIPPKTTMLVLLDYLQLMKNTPDELRTMSREERIEHTCNELMRICKNENIALVMLSQFSREADKRKTEKYDSIRPKMSDLKGSGAIEANAVMVLLLCRPEYHGIFVSPKGRNLRGKCEINIAKGRYVNPEPVYVNFIGKYSKFEDEKEEEEDIKTTTEPDF